MLPYIAYNLCCLAIYLKPIPLKFVVELLVNFCVEASGARAGRVVIGGKPTFGLKVRSELVVPFIPVMVGTGEFGGFCDVRGVGVFHCLCQLFDQVQHHLGLVGLRVGTGMLVLFLLAFTLFLLVFLGRQCLQGVVPVLGAGEDQVFQ